MPVVSPEQQEGAFRPEGPFLCLILYCMLIRELRKDHERSQAVASDYGTYYVSYNIFEGDSRLIGDGGAVMNLTPPRSLSEIVSLGEQITQNQRRAGDIGRRHYVKVTGWSKMGA